MFRHTDEEPEEVAITANPDGSVTTTINAQPVRTIELIQHLTDKETAPPGAASHYGRLASLKWYDPNLFGRLRIFTAEATETDGTVHKLTITNMTLGYPGTGPTDAVEVLVQLGIAERHHLRTCLLKPAPGVEPQNAWKTHLQPSDFGLQYTT